MLFAVSTDCSFLNAKKQYHLNDHCTVISHCHFPFGLKFICLVRRSHLKPAMSLFISYSHQPQKHGIQLPINLNSSLPESRQWLLCNIPAIWDTEFFQVSTIFPNHTHTWIRDSPTASYIKCVNFWTKFCNSIETIISYAVNVPQSDYPQFREFWYKVDEDIVTQFPATSEYYLLKIWSWSIWCAIVILFSSNPDALSRQFLQSKTWFNLSMSLFVDMVFNCITGNPVTVTQNQSL